MNGPHPILDPAAILQAWLPFKELVGPTTIKSQADYDRIASLVNVLLDAIRDDATHPLSDVLHYLTVQMEAYEEAHVAIPEADPKAVLRFLMEQHGLNQSDLGDCAPQSHISAILAGKRGISKETAKKLAKRFHVNADLFL
uniref:Putative transcription regulator containing HTH domain n=1 Tax=Desulfovibrio sp. U5L TaxID=596152 RepID=I2Q7P0_9BACT